MGIPNTAYTYSFNLLDLERKQCLIFNLDTNNCFVQINMNVDNIIGDVQLDCSTSKIKLDRKKERNCIFKRIVQRGA